jgi:hypothetical protein
MMRSLWAGPYVGEFGWELFYWQGWLRKYAEGFDEVYVACREGHELFYEDFASRIEVYPDVGHVTDCEKCMGFKYDDRHESLKSKWTEVILPWTKSHFRPTLADQEIATLGYSDIEATGYDVLLHARATDKYGTGYRNWAPVKWLQLLEELSGLDIAFIGSKEAALCPEGQTDLRGIPLKALTSTMQVSGVIAGPSSGPLHLATLCFLPQVVWTGPHKNVERYKTEWNPFGVCTEVIEPLPGAEWNDQRGWDADVEVVAENIRKTLSSRDWSGFTQACTGIVREILRRRQ